MTLAVNTLRRYLSLPSATHEDPDDPDSPLVGGGGDPEMLDRALKSAIGSCRRFTRGRQLVPLPPDHVVRCRASGDEIRVPDVRELSRVTVGGEPVDLEHVELIRWPDADAPAPWIRLPAPAAGAIVTAEGLFGFDPLPEDLEDSIYVFASRRYRERDAQYADAVDIGDGQSAAYFRSMPANVRQAWEYFRIPEPAFVSVPIGHS